ncbi:hypothetical protein K402DRAFT_136519 [Aulographum hederae CBS 113979]|uniref:Uncharacterized protein n=1 Tax=Aulographum hederae CBS 113979 TaxID=1176131 RepID=A0A6G1GVK0_9PEZI|nr:hypothetical protein K402DRAFT_136519 [Aulographum hederae CBS 113979]
MVRQTLLFPQIHPSPCRLLRIYAIQVGNPSNPKPSTRSPAGAGVVLPRQASTRGCAKGTGRVGLVELLLDFPYATSRFVDCTSIEFARTLASIYFFSVYMHYARNNHHSRRKVHLLGTWTCIVLRTVSGKIDGHLRLSYTVAGLSYTSRPSTFRE